MHIVLFSSCCCNKWSQTVYWNNTALSSCSSGAPKFKMGLTDIKLRYQQICISSGGSRGESVYFRFPASKGCLHSLVYSPTSFSLLLLLSHLFWLRLCCIVFYKNPCDYIGPTQITPYLKILNLIITALSLLPWKVACLQVPGISCLPCVGKHLPSEMPPSAALQEHTVWKSTLGLQPLAHLPLSPPWFSLHPRCPWIYGVDYLSNH